MNEELEELDRFSDDGCPNFGDIESEYFNSPTEPRSKERGLTRRQRNILHATTLLVLAGIITIEGMKKTDMAFFFLSLLYEIWP